MKKYVRGYLVGLLSAFIIFSSISVFAGDGLSMISVALNKINISINGNQVAKVGDTYTLANGKKVPFSILYEGTTYLPMRKLGELAGKNVKWYGETNTAGLNDSEYIEKVESIDGVSVSLNNPSIEAVSAAIKRISTIKDIGIVTEDNDPNNQLGKQGGYTGALFFVDSNALETEGDDVFEKGTDGGGSIEIYANSQDATKRDAYLANFDGSALSSGSHVVVGTLVIRISNKMTASQQDTLQQQIIDALAGKAIKYDDVSQKTGINDSDIIAPLKEINTGIELEKYLKDNFGELKTDLKIFNLKDYIQVLENEDQFKCYDIAIVIDWSAFEAAGYYNIRNSIKYTDEQKKAFDDSIKAYQKNIAEVAFSAMPTKKIRGGFLDFGYEYPNLKMDYYEGAPFGWKNYDYSTNIFPYYEDTKITKFHWHSFNDLQDPYDIIGLFD